MKIIVYLSITTLIFAATILAGLASNEPALYWAMGIGAWALFSVVMIRRMRKLSSKRMGEKLFEDHMRSTSQERIRF